MFAVVVAALTIIAVITIAYLAVREQNRKERREDKEPSYRD